MHNITIEVRLLFYFLSISNSLVLTYDGLTPTSSMGKVRRKAQGDTVDTVKICFVYN